jgi:adenine deaminase
VVVDRRFIRGAATGVVLSLFFVFLLAPSSSSLAQSFQFSDEWKSRQALIPVALGQEPADLLVEGGQVLIAQTGELKRGWIIAAKGRRIAYFGPGDESSKAAPDKKMLDTLVGPDTVVIDASGRTLVPGFGHSHNHIESSRLSPDRYAQVVLPMGTTWLSEGDHEAANVAGEAGVTFWLDMQPRHFKVFPVVSSAVPPTDESMEPTGGWFGYQVARDLFSRDSRVRSVGEVMYEPGIQDPSSRAYNRLHQVMQAGWDARQVIQGHTGSNDYGNISTFRNVAIRSSHNLHGGSEGINDHVARVARLGMWTDAPPNREEFGAVVRGIYAANSPYVSSFVTLSTDDRDLPELMEWGDINYNIRRYVEEAWSAIEAGEIDVSRDRVVIDAFRAASYNPAALLHLEEDVGSFSPGAFADVVILKGQTVEEIAQVVIERVIASGTLVVTGGQLIEGVEPTQTPPTYALRTVELERQVTAEDFRVLAPEGKATVSAWLWKPFDFRERPDQVELPVENGVVQYGSELGVFKMVALERHLSQGPEPAKELQMGIMFTATSPSHPCSAVATTVQHDAHQLTIHGSCDEAIALAVNRVAEIGGGFVVVADGEVKAEVELPLMGLMSNEDPESLLRALEKMRAASDALNWAGFGLPGHPTDRMTFWYLTPAPWRWNLTTRGLFDLTTGEQLPVIW